MLNKIKARVKDIIHWSTQKPDCGRGIISGTFCRNWRTWVGHSMVTDGVTALASLPLLFTNYWVFIVAAHVAYVAINLFYMNREFGKNGNFHDDNDPRVMGDERKDKKTDSVMDFLVPLGTSTFIKFNFGVPVMLTLTCLQAVATYTVYAYDRHRE